MFELVPFFEILIVVVNVYVPPLTYMVSPATDFDTAYVIVRYGSEIVPVFESNPVVETYIVLAKMAGAISCPTSSAKHKEMKKCFIKLMSLSVSDE